MNRAVQRPLFAVWRTIAGWMRPSRAANERRLRGRGESIQGLTIREATLADVPALARLHVETWNATYAPFLLKGPPARIREQQWRDAFARHDPLWFCFVVERRDGELLGFAQANRSTHPLFAGELNKIYVRQAYQRLGLGRRLIGRVARRFVALGVTSMWLYGDARNPSRRAWLALGAEKLDRDPGIGNYGWRDLGELARLPE